MKIAVVCLGNICRSPMGEALLRGLGQARGVGLEVCSGGTANWHIGQEAHPLSVAALAEIGFDLSGHKARQFSPYWFDQHDLVLAMDQQNLADLLALARSDKDRAKVRMLRSFDNQASQDAEVADPYGHSLDEYRRARDQIMAASNGLLNHMIAQAT